MWPCKVPYGLEFDAHILKNQFTMAITKEHIRFSINFAFHLKKNAAKATAMICAAYGENAVTHTTCKR